MNPISAFFVRNIIVVYFFYGASFFALGLALIFASRRRSSFRFVQAILPLAAFGLLHAAHEWLEMFQKIGALTAGNAPTLGEESIRILLLVLSFLCLLSFGMYLLSPPSTTWRRLLAPLAALAMLWGASLALASWRLQTSAQDALALADVLARYGLAIPGALLGTWALMRQQRTFREHAMPQFGRDLVWAATALALFGIVGQIFVRPTALAPSNFFNSTTFLQWFGIPVQLFRGVMAAALTYFIARALSAFELESQRRLDEAISAKVAAQEAQLEAERYGRRESERLYQEVQKREDLLGKLLRQVVGAQEAERQRIARELHDATGQSLTAISLGLKGVETALERASAQVSHPAVKGQVHELGAMSTNALGELRQIIADLRPSHLDDLGLAPALRWYLQKYEERRGIRARLTTLGDIVRLPAEYETVLFRITQEALTNVAKHAAATQVNVTLTQTPGAVELLVEDDGRGFDASAASRRDATGSGWGLVGMQERAALLRGRVTIDSQPGQGTRVRVSIPLPMEPTNGGQDQTTAGG